MTLREQTVQALRKAIDTAPLPTGAGTRVIGDHVVARVAAAAPHGTFVDEAGETPEEHNERLALELIARAFAVVAAAQQSSTKRGACQVADTFTRYILTGAHPE